MFSNVSLVIQQITAQQGFRFEEILQQYADSATFYNASFNRQVAPQIGCESDTGQGDFPQASTNITRRMSQKDKN